MTDMVWPDRKRGGGGMRLETFLWAEQHCTAFPGKVRDGSAHLSRLRG